MNMKNSATFAPQNPALHNLETIADCDGSVYINMLNSVLNINTRGINPEQLDALTKCFPDAPMVTMLETTHALKTAPIDPKQIVANTVILPHADGTTTTVVFVKLHIADEWIITPLAVDLLDEWSDLTLVLDTHRVISL